jgi:RNA polymerase sigma-70 factor (ECF subfamily)
MNEFATNSEQTEHLLEQVRSGDHGAVDRLFARHRDYLCQFVQLRLDPKLRPRVDPSDLVQEAHLEAVRRLSDYLQETGMPFRLWLRQIAHDRLLKARRYHLGTARRSLQLEMPLPDGSGGLLAQQLFATGSSPSQRLGRRELEERLQEALAQLPQTDREIVLLRTIEGLSYQEVGYLLTIEPAAARKRHGRALVRLHKIIFAGGLTESSL